MSRGTLYDKVWELHEVGKLDSGETQLFVGMHLVHEVTSPQAFEMLRERGLKLMRPDFTAATIDHIIPTDDLSRPFKDGQAEAMASELERNVKEFGIKNYFSPGSGKQGVCHVTFAEQGLVWPGMVVVCGDSHTSTYGALGALSFGLGTTQVSHVLATQTVAMDPLKVKRINFNGSLGKGVTAKDVAIYMIRQLGTAGGVGFAYEFGGKAVDEMSIEGRLTLCNMAVEGGARSGYVNPDATTFEFLRGKSFAPNRFEEAVEYWKSIASDSNSLYDAIANIDASQIKPMVTWGVNPAQAIGFGECVPRLKDFPEEKRKEVKDALNYMGLEEGQEIEGTPIDIAFIGSCTNGRLPDLIAAAEVMLGKKVAVPTIVVPGSEEIKYTAEKIGLDKVFTDAGAEWRKPGCSMCLAMNSDRLAGYQRSASTSNRNFKGRQGSPTGRTHLMSPYSAAASAIEGKLTSPLKYLVQMK